MNATQNDNDCILHAFADELLANNHLNFPPCSFCNELKTASYFYHVYIASAFLVSSYVILTSNRQERAVVRSAKAK
jgi:hypothetical protein